MEYPRGLIRYTTQHAEEGKPSHILRPRVIIYALILLGFMAAIFYAIGTRVPLGLDILRDRNRLYNETHEGLIENVYTLKVINMDDKTHDYVLSVSGIEGIKVVMNRPQIQVASGEVADISLRLQADPYELKSRSTGISFKLQAADNADIQIESESRFLAPTGIK
jgi:polyferredoxin